MCIGCNTTKEFAKSVRIWQHKYAQKKRNMPKHALTLLFVLINSTCIVPNVYGGKTPSKPNIVIVLADDMG